MRRRFRRTPPRAFWVCAVIACAIVARYWWGGAKGGHVFHAAQASGLAANLVPGECEVLQVERGDLIKVRQQVPVLGKQVTQLLEVQVQLLGVSTHEESTGTLDAGKEFTIDFLKSGPAWLELDRRRIDPRGHFLAYLYAGDRLLNEEFLRAGLGQADIYPGDNQTMHKAFVKAEKDAHRAGRGKWAAAQR